MARFEFYAFTPTPEALAINIKHGLMLPSINLGCQECNEAEALHYCIQLELHMPQLGEVGYRKLDDEE